MKNSNDTIGNRTRDLMVCSAVPRPTAPPHTLAQYRTRSSTYRTAPTVAKQNSDEPGCTIHVDTHYTVPVPITAVFLKISLRLETAQVVDSVKN
jgi:hypothetical protein